MTAIRTTLVLLLLVSGVYPALVWAIGQLAFRDEANGSLLTRDGVVVGSSLIGQSFTSERYFHPRPGTYDGRASGGSNLGPTSRKLRERVILWSGGLQPTARSEGSSPPLPVDAVTTSASGLDPHISPAYAHLQIARVARARGLDEPRLRALVEQHVEHRFLGVYGELRVNVLLLNLALDAMMRGHAASRPG